MGWSSTSQIFERDGFKGIIDSGIVLVNCKVTLQFKQWDIERK